MCVCLGGASNFTDTRGGGGRPPKRAPRIPPGAGRTKGPAGGEARGRRPAATGRSRSPGPAPSRPAPGARRLPAGEEPRSAPAASGALPVPFPGAPRLPSPPGRLRAISRGGSNLLPGVSRPTPVPPLPRPWPRRCWLLPGGALRAARLRLPPRPGVPGAGWAGLGWAVHGGAPCLPPSSSLLSCPLLSRPVLSCPAALRSSGLSGGVPGARGGGGRERRERGREGEGGEGPRSAALSPPRKHIPPRCRQAPGGGAEEVLRAAAWGGKEGEKGEQGGWKARTGAGRRAAGREGSPWPPSSTAWPPRLALAAPPQQPRRARDGLSGIAGVPAVPQLPRRRPPSPYLVAFHQLHARRRGWEHAGPPRFPAPGVRERQGAGGVRVLSPGAEPSRVPSPGEGACCSSPSAPRRGEPLMEKGKVALGALRGGKVPQGALCFGTDLLPLELVPVLLWEG